jgi:hypothetical protein
MLGNDKFQLKYFRGSETDWTGLSKDMCDLDCFRGSQID